MSAKIRVVNRLQVVRGGWAFVARLDLTPGTTTLSTSQLRRLRLAILDDLIDDVLLKQFLAQNGPIVEPAEIEKHFQAFQIVLRVPTNATPGERASAKQKLAAIRAALVAGTTSFGDAAKKFSEDPTGRSP